jgi:hypothetical protein
MVLVRFITIIILVMGLVDCNTSATEKASEKRPSINVQATKAKAKQALAFCKAN